jgi:NTE family protein
LALEALDEMGISPAAIAGTSVSAIIGGVCRRTQGACDLESSIATLKQSLRGDEQVVASAGGRFADLVLLGRGNSVLLAPEIRLDLFWLSVCQSFRGSPYRKLYRGDE